MFGSVGSASSTVLPGTGTFHCVVPFGWVFRSAVRVRDPMM